MMFALVLSILVEGQPQNIIVSYQNTPDECEVKAHRINSLISKEKNVTNILHVRCEKLQVFIGQGQSNA